MSRWFRLYEDVLNDPKVQTLPAADFKAWINLLCVASQNDGRLPDVEAIAFALRETVDAVSTVLERLSHAGLIDTRSGGRDGGHYAPHAWEKRQYRSDTSTERVKRFRERSKAVAETVNGTGPDTETDTDTERKKATPKKVSPKPAASPKWVLPDDIPVQPWNDYVDMRVRIGKRMTERAKQLAVDKLRELALAGHAPEAVLNNSVMNSWQGLFAPRDFGAGRPGTRQRGDMNWGPGDPGHSGLGQ